MKTKTMKMLALLLMISAGSAFAASGGAEQVGSGMLILFFIGFAAMVLLFQATPACITFYAMLKGLFSTEPSKASFSPFKNSKNDK